MITIPIKPLSVNECWQGKRYKTPAYKDFEYHVMMLLPNDYIPPEPPLSLSIYWGFSSPLSDCDNPTKPFQDILSRFYSFNDRCIDEVHLYRRKAAKGEEYIAFELISTGVSDGT